MKHNSTNQLNYFIDSMNPIGLEDLEAVRMMNRIDTKYQLNVMLLNRLFNEISEQYFVVEINGQKKHPYSSLYYDTYANDMYLDHHNGKSNRIKIRFRKYMISNDSFLEIKFKRKGRTKKQRIQVEDILDKLDIESANYIERKTPFMKELLQPVIYTDFDRITIVNKDFTERATIDRNLNFRKGKNKQEFPYLAIIETKQDGNSEKSLLQKTLENYRIKANGMSKYCIGRACLDNDLKKNRFKEKLLRIKKIENTRIVNT